MSRVRKAMVAATFTYVQFALAIASGLVLVPLFLSHLGPRTYGMWLVSGEVLAYAAMLDLGVLAIVPWLTAQADGAGEERAVRRVLINGLTVGVLAGAAVAVLAAALWWLLPLVVTVTDADRTVLAGPLSVVVLGIALTYPARVFNAVLVGLQDFTFIGALAVGQVALNLLITVALLLSGHGLYALVFGMVVPPFVIAVASLIRLLAIRPSLFHDWDRPTRASLLTIVPDGLGAWIAALGWQMVSATSGVVVTLIGHAELVAVYACTAKLSQVLFQLSRVLPDSGLIGLAQLSGEGRPHRMLAAVMTIVRVHLVLAGAAAGVILALNPLFVSWWVGSELFGGLVVNAVLALGLVFMGLTHGLVCSAAVVGNRPKVGAVTLAYGALNLALALALGALWGLPGIAAAPIISGVGTLLPLALRLLKPVTGVGALTLAREVWRPWLVRVVPYLAITAVVGVFASRVSGVHAPGLVLFALVMGGLYLWWMRPLYRDLPVDPKVRDWLVRLHLGALIGLEPLERSAR